MLIDTHCHLDFKDFDPDRQELIVRSREQGIENIINVGSSLEGTEKSIALSQKYDFVYASAGIHPHEADRINRNDLERFSRLMDSEKVVAVGEIGLDYFRDIASRDNQKRLFRKMLGAAKEKGLPVIIHNRDAHEDTLRILKEIMGDSVNGVMHCFSGDETFLERCLGIGMFVSFTCNITFKKAEKLREVVKLVPVDRLFLETDAPFLAPQAFRGRRNEPAYVRFLAEEIARIKDMSFEEVARITTINAKSFFNLP
ncbi:MAG: TatD family hydrolase [Candidatus Omnitrophica bacterium]|nr:TatD family hydrolase [Candidatus Omnitrophota bacterium]MBU4149824.1 TatD family hydrolase [Candidatus Omnitrophota bacterium]